ncbi:unnamed protein product, partial [Dicrocoelium dendriticum]
KSKREFESSKRSNVADENSQFVYAVDLLRTSRTSNLEYSVNLFEDLFKRTVDDGIKRDCLFYMAVAYTKLADYERAVECCDGILKVQPQNHQADLLKQEILRRVKRDGITGIAAVGGAILAGVAVLGIGLGIGLARRK